VKNQRDAQGIACNPYNIVVDNGERLTTIEALFEGISKTILPESWGTPIAISSDSARRGALSGSPFE